MLRKILTAIAAVTMLAGCGAKSGAAQTDVPAGETAEVEVPAFDRDSAMSYLTRQLDFGPRVPNSAAHRAAGDWLVSELERHGAKVTEQRADLRAFDGTTLHARNIFGQYNPEMGERLLLLAHYDTRPWADQDPDEGNRRKPVPGANDGASGVAVLLEAARQFAARNPGRGVDILFVDAEDYGADGDEESWALGAKHFATHPIVEGYRPRKAILLDMVGGKGATFPAEYFSRENAADLDDAFRAAARRAGYGDYFPMTMGGAITDDHVQLIEAGIPAIDIIDFNRERGFPETWHTLADDRENVSAETLGAVGGTLMEYVYSF